MTLITLGEYGTSEKVLPYALAASVATASGGTLSLVPAGPGGVRLSAAQHVGVVAVDDIEVRIVPKVPMANVLAMLASATGLIRDLPGAADLATQDDMLRTTIAFFARSATNLLGLGPQRAYVAFEERLVAPRGRLLVGALSRRGNIPSPIDCSFDELTVDTKLNRYVLRAIETSLRVAGLDGRTRRLLRHARAALDGVTSQHLQADAIDAHIFTRLDERYRPTIALGRLILGRLALHHTAGGHRVQTFTVDMNRLFEDWVAASLPRHLPSGVHLDTQTKRHLDVAGKLSIRPDIELRRGRRTVAVADTKYKLTSTGVGRVGDYYQAHAYATVLGLKAATLIYCQHDGDAPSIRTRVEGTDIDVFTTSINLAGPLADLDGELQRLALSLVSSA